MVGKTSVYILICVSLPVRAHIFAAFWWGNKHRWSGPLASGSLLSYGLAITEHLFSARAVGSPKYKRTWRKRVGYAPFLPWCSETVVAALLWSPHSVMEYSGKPLGGNVAGGGFYDWPESEAAPLHASTHSTLLCCIYTVTCAPLCQCEYCIFPPRRPWSLAKPSYSALWITSLVNQYCWCSSGKKYKAWVPFCGWGWLHRGSDKIELDLNNKYEPVSWRKERRASDTKLWGSNGWFATGAPRMNFGSHVTEV